MELLIILGLAAFLGLQHSIALALQHRSASTSAKTACNRVLRSPHSFLGKTKIPVAYLGALFYAGTLGELLHIFDAPEPSLRILTIFMGVGLAGTFYYAGILIFRLKARCMSCMRLYAINIVMGLSLWGCYVYR